MASVRKAVILIGGLGTRFLPITKSFPKELFPIINRPILDLVIDELVDSGIKDILIVSSPNKKQVEDYYQENKELEEKLSSSNHELLVAIQNIAKKANISFIYQDKPMGTGHATKLAEAFVAGEAFALVYPDNLFKNEHYPAIKQMIDVYEKKEGSIIGVVPVPTDEIHKYGIVKFKNAETQEIETFIEKPKSEEAPSNLAAMGRYILTSNIFGELAKIEPVNGEYMITDAIANLFKKEAVYAHIIEGTYFDTGNPLGYLIASLNYAIDNPRYKDEIKKSLNLK